jgi:hypothetical protein
MTFEEFKLVCWTNGISIERIEAARSFIQECGHLIAHHSVNLNQLSNDIALLNTRCLQGIDDKIEIAKCYVLNGGDLNHV